MTEETRQLMHSSASNEWATPQAFFDKLNAEFQFDLDAAATFENAKCSLYYAEADNGISLAWNPLTVWLNPPYGRGLSAWMKKAHEESRKGATVVCLVPARTDTKWFWDYCAPHEIRFVKGRLKFEGLNADGTRCDAAAPFPSMVVVMRPPGSFLHVLRVKQA